jgi:branched-chain amino acid transport system ATP-binding protein
MSRTSERSAPAGVGDRVDSPLQVENLTVRFAGITALDDVSFEVRPRSVHAIIGPNGAGKSTCFNVISGVYRATSGGVQWGDAALGRLKPHDIAGLGVARTFQNLAFSLKESVLENIMVGRHLLMRQGMLTAGLWLPHGRREEAHHRAAAAHYAELCGLSPYLDLPVGILPYGIRKRAELARAICSEPKLLLLDEPVAGMNSVESQSMVEVIQAMRRALDLTVLLVEHDMPLVMRVAETITVLDFGKKIAEGTPDQIKNDPAVIEAYVGGAAHLSDSDSNERKTL